VRNVGRLLDLAAMFCQSGRLKQAEQAYRLVLRWSPGHPTAYYNLGIIYYRMEKFDLSIVSYMSSLEVEPENVDTLYNIGLTFKAQGKFNEAIACYEYAASIDAHDADVLYNLGVLFELEGEYDNAIKWYKEAILVDPDYRRAHNNLAVLHHRAGELEMAALSYNRLVALGYHVASATHMLAALRGKTTPTAPLEYIRDVFDAYASDFEHELVDHLEYGVPGRLLRECRRSLGRSLRFRNVVDLGCGTGLAGREFRGISAMLTGVDISENMIRAAREKGGYDILEVGDIQGFLQNTGERYDLFIATDVFIYVGDLRQLFALVAGCSRPKALFVFSTERCKGTGYLLRDTGRYAHSVSYVADLARRCHFSVEMRCPAGIRKERGRWIAGDLFALRRRH